MPPEFVRDGKLDGNAAAEALRRFLEDVIRASHWDLRATVKAVAPRGDGEAADSAEILADLDGQDKEILLERGAEVLRALEHLALKVLRLEPAHYDKIHLDCGGYRALRLEELRMTARVAAERVQVSKQPFRLNPMAPRERRIVHLALKDMPGVRTESIGTGAERQVVIYPAEAKPAR